MPKHKCGQCGKQFDLKRYLTKHEQRHENEKKVADDEKVEALKCSMCEKEFPRFSHLQRHQLTHFNVRDFACAFCDEKFGQKAHLTRHIGRKHPNETSGEVTWCTCATCGHVFRTVHEMKVHRQAVHTKLRCERCSETVEGNEEMRRHEMKCRNGQRQCGQCGASFGRAADLVSHQMSCLNRVSFVCNPCEEYFRQRVQLDRHIKNVHFRSEKCSNCEHVSESPVQNARHSLECRKMNICGYCNHRDPDTNHITDNHWHRLKRPMTIRKAKKESEKRKNELEIVPEREKGEEDLEEDVEDLEDSEDSEESEDVGRNKDDEEVEKTDMFLDNFAESTSSHQDLNFSSSAFDEKDAEEYLTFSISPKSTDLSFNLRGKLPEQLKLLFPELEETSIVLLNSTSTSRSRMLVQVPVQIAKNNEKEAEMRKWLENPIFL